MNIGKYRPYIESFESSVIIDSKQAVVNVLTGMSVTMSVISLSVCILSIVSMWMIFEKAAEPGWKCLIPIYNLYTFFKITWRNGWYFLLMFIPIVNLIK